MRIEYDVPAMDAFGFLEQAGHFHMMPEQFEHKFVVVGSHCFGMPLHTENLFFGMLHGLVDTIRGNCRFFKFGCDIFDCLMMERVDEYIRFFL